MSRRKETSAGILLFRWRDRKLQVLIGHPGGPFWAKRHEGAWSIPKGLLEPGELPQTAALREFAEETGYLLDSPDLIDLGEVNLRSGKRVLAWAVQGDLDPTTVTSSLVSMEWPPGSGRVIEFPEIDRVEWCRVDRAGVLLNPAQTVLVTRLQEYLDCGE